MMLRSTAPSAATALAHGDKMGTATPMPQMPIECAMDSLHQAERALATRVSLLAERLTPVLRAPNAAGPAGKDMPAAYAGDSPLCRAIYEREASVINSIAAIDELLARLELGC